MMEGTPGAHLRRVEIMILPYARSAAKFDRALKLAVDGAHTRHGEAVRRRGREAVDERRRAGRRRQVEVPAQRHAAVDGLVRAEVAPRRPAAGARRARGPDGEFHGRVSICAAAGDGAPSYHIPLDGPDAR